MCPRSHSSKFPNPSWTWLKACALSVLRQITTDRICVNSSESAYINYPTFKITTVCWYIDTSDEVGLVLLEYVKPETLCIYHTNSKCSSLS